MGEQMGLFARESIGVASRLVPPDTYRLSRGEDTSAEAVEDLAATGALSSQRQAVLDALAAMGPGEWTAREVSIHMRVERYMVSRRLPDLRELRLVAEGPTRPCGISGRASKTWRVVS